MGLNALEEVGTIGANGGDPGQRLGAVGQKVRT